MADNVVVEGGRLSTKDIGRCTNTRVLEEVSLSGNVFQVEIVQLSTRQQVARHRLARFVFDKLDVGVRQRVLLCHS
jgi:hypothetical protein